MNEAQIKHMATRFLSWKLPADFRPDGGIEFKPEFNTEWMASQGKPTMKHEPFGTNLFNYEQALDMVSHMVKDLMTEIEIEMHHIIDEEINAAIHAMRWREGRGNIETIRDGVAAAYAVRDGKPVEALDDSTHGAFNDFLAAFEGFKRANDERMRQIEERISTK